VPEGFWAVVVFDQSLEGGLCLPCQHEQPPRAADTIAQHHLQLKRKRLGEVEEAGEADKVGVQDKLRAIFNFQREVPVAQEHAKCKALGDHSLCNCEGDKR